MRCRGIFQRGFNLMSLPLAMQGDDKAMETLLGWSDIPGPGARASVNPSSYADRRLDL